MNVDLLRIDDHAVSAGEAPPPKKPWHVAVRPDVEFEPPCLGLTSRFMAFGSYAVACARVGEIPSNAGGELDRVETSLGTGHEPAGTYGGRSVLEACPGRLALPLATGRPWRSDASDKALAQRAEVGVDEPIRDDCRKS